MSAFEKIFPRTGMAPDAVAKQVTDAEDGCGYVGRHLPKPLAIKLGRAASISNRAIARLVSDVVECPAQAGRRIYRDWRRRVR